MKHIPSLALILAASALIMCSCGGANAGGSTSKKGIEVTEKEAQKGPEDPAEVLPEGLYRDFLTGDAKLYTDKKNFRDYDEEGKEFSYYGDNDGFTLEEFTDKVEELSAGGYYDGSLSSVAYTLIDCGADGTDELAIHAEFTNSTGDNVVREYVVKEYDGRLQLVYHSESFFQAMVGISNIYGRVNSYGSFGQAYMTGSTGYIGAEGDYQLLYNLTINYNTSFLKVDPRFEAALENTREDLTKLYIRSYSFGEENGETYYCGESDTSSGMDLKENVRILQSLCDEAGVRLYSIDEINGMIADREKSLNITDKIKNGEAPQWHLLLEK